MQKIDKNVKFNFWYIIVAFLIFLMINNFIANRSQVKHIPYSEFNQLLIAKKIKKVTIGKNTITAELANINDKEKYIQTNKVPLNLASELEKYDVEFSQEIENTFFIGILSWVLPIIIFFAIWSFLAQKVMGKGGMGGSFMSVGKSKAKIFVETDIKTTFDSVAGVDEAKVELKELVDFLKYPDKYSALGSRMPKGVLLVGPPGTGKTLIARAVAGEASVPFFSTNGAEFVEMFVGVGAARVRDLFEQAKQKSPCIIFIDELDALGKVRMAGPMHGNDEKEQTLNQLLVELDGFDSSSGIILLAATNRPEILDPALLRSGRFDRQVLIDKPDKDGRLEILKIYSKNKKFDAGTDLEKIAAITPGFTGADLENLVNEASLIAVRAGENTINNDHLTQAIERIIAGLEKKNRLINPFERKVVAHHEMGHAIVAKVLSDTERVHKISIIPRGIGALGYTIQRPTEDRFLMTKDELMNKIVVLLGGRAAESIIFEHLSTGASDDLDRATDIAWNIVTKYGMDKKLGSVVYDKSQTTFLGDIGQAPKSRIYSDETAREIDCSVKELLISCLELATSILNKNKELLLKSAALLLEKETLTEEELQPLFAEIEKTTSS